MWLDQIIRDLKEHHHKEEYIRVLLRKIRKWDEVSDVKQMWERVRHVVVDRVRELYGSLRAGRKNPKGEGWNGGTDDAGERRKPAWEDMLVARMGVMK